MKIYLLALSLLCSNTALAYFATAETGEVVPAQHYRFGLEPQIIFTDSDFNLEGHMDMNVREDASIRVLLGTGDVGFSTGLMYKWIPIPDYGDQPAIGFKAGMIYARKDNLSNVSLRLHPLISKKFETDYGLMIPFASIPLGYTSVKNKSITPVQLVAGGEWKPTDLENIQFGAELGFDIKDAFSYISGYIVIYMDDTKGFQFK